MWNWVRHYSKGYRIIRALAEVVAWMGAQGGEGGREEPI